MAMPAVMVLLGKFTGRHTCSLGGGHSMHYVTLIVMDQTPKCQPPNVHVLILGFRDNQAHEKDLDTAKAIGHQDRILISRGTTNL
jgi:hypothetical protein